MKKKTNRTRRTSARGGRADVERIAEAVSRPGIDPRTWVTTARVEGKDEAAYYDPDYGWIIDAEAQGGSIHGASLACRQGSNWPGVDGYGTYSPPVDGEEIVVVLPGGDPEEDPIMVGVVTNSGAKPPSTVAGRTVSPDGKTTPGGSVGAPDCEFSKSPYSVVREWDGELHYRAQWLTFEAGSSLAGIKLGGWSASHPIARADELETALSAFADAVSTAVAAVAPPPAAQALASAIQLFKLALLTKIPSPGVVVT